MKNNKKDEKYLLRFSCVVNDSFTIEFTRGLNTYTGYEFIVNKEDKKEMYKFIKETIESNDLPIDHIYAYKLEPDNKDEVDTKEDVVRKVLEGKQKVLDQLEISEREYGKNLRGSKIVKAINIYAFCVLRDPNVPKEACWAKYAGYQFLVRKKDKDKMMKFIKEAIISNGVPFIKISAKDEELTNVNNLDTKEEIVKEILFHKEYLLYVFNEHNEAKKK
jgi:hypothetical protein